MLSSHFRTPRSVNFHQLRATPLFALRWSSSSSSLQKENESLKQALQTANETLISMKHEANEMKLRLAKLEAVPARVNDEMPILAHNDSKQTPEKTVKVLSMTKCPKLIAFLCKEISTDLSGN